MQFFVLKMIHTQQDKSPPDDIAGYSDLSDTFIVAPKDEER